MRIDRPDPRPRISGDYWVDVTKGYGDPTADIWLDEQGELRLQWVHVDDCDRLIRAATDAKERIIRYRAQMEAPHGRAHFYKGTCQLCGKPEDDELHAEPASRRYCESIAPHTLRRCTEQGPHDQHRNGSVVWDEAATEAAGPLDPPAEVLATMAARGMTEQTAPSVVRVAGPHPDASAFRHGYAPDESVTA